MSELLEMIRDAEKICILGHTNPDGDCLGSTLGLRQYIRDNYAEKKVNVYLQQANERFSFMPGINEIIHEPSKRKYDLCIICDCGVMDRTGEFRILAEQAKAVFVLDHHVPGEDVFSHAVVRPEASSASEVVFDQLEKEKISREAGMCFYVGIIDDTGVFKYNCTSPHTMEIAGYLMTLGFDFGKLIDDVFYSKSYAEQQVMGRVLMESCLLMDKRVLVGWLRIKDMQFYKVTTREVGGIVGQMRETRGIDCAVFCYEVSNQVYKVSLRSNNTLLDVEKTAAFFGGGGHKMAAGCTIQGNIYDVVNNVTKLLAEQLDSADFISNRAAFQ